MILNPKNCTSFRHKTEWSDESSDIFETKNLSQNSHDKWDFHEREKSVNLMKDVFRGKFIACKALIESEKRLPQNSNSESKNISEYLI